MQLLLFFVTLILVLILSFIDDSNRRGTLQTSNGKNENVMPVVTITSNTNRKVHPSTNDTIFSSEAHLTFLMRRDSTSLTPQDEAFLDSAMILAFNHSKILMSTPDDNGQFVQMIDAQIVGRTTINNNKMNCGKEIRRNLRYRPQRNRYYRIYDYSILLDFGCGNLCGDKSGFWDRRRYAKIADTHSTDKLSKVFGREICQALRASTFDVFKTVKDCRIRFA